MQELNRIFFKDKDRENDATLVHLKEMLGSVGVVQDFVKFVRSSKKGTSR